VGALFLSFSNNAANQKSTLIIGAGASKAINNSICTGYELIKDIADRVTDRTSPGKEYLSEKLKEQLGIPISIREEFLFHLDNYMIRSNNVSLISLYKNKRLGIIFIIYFN